MSYRPDLLPKIRSSKIRSAMSDFPCTARVSSFYPGHKCSIKQTVVGAHLPAFGQAMSSKPTDISIAGACFNCHQIIDGVDMKKLAYIEEKYPTAYAERLRMGMVETITLLICEGIILVPDNSELSNYDLNEAYDW